MRKFASAVVLFALGLALGACGSSSPSSGTTSTKPTTSGTTQATSTASTSTGTTTSVPTSWSGPPQAGPDGSIAIDGFNEYAATHLPAEKRVPRELAVEFLRPSGSYDVQVTNRVGGATVVVLQDNLEDDSVHAIRHELGFGLVTGGKWRLFTAKAAYKCQQGRGHQNFTAELCS